jgi:hypothetical protein
MVGERQPKEEPMVTRRTSRKTVDLGHSDTIRLGPHRVLERGDEATVMLPERTLGLRMRFVRADSDGNLTFAHPRNNGLRTVTPDKVRAIHRIEKLRKT